MQRDEPTLAQRTLQHRLADLPESAFPHVKMGYGLLSTLDDIKLKAVVEYVSSNLAKRTRYDPDVAAKISSVDRNIVGDLLSAVAVTVGSVIDIDVSKDDFLSYVPSDLVEESQRGTIGKILDITLGQKDFLKLEFARSKVANSVLPSFRYVEHSVDIRLSFNDTGEVDAKVPIAVVYISTDTDQSIWFQASPSDLSELIVQLDKLKERLVVACQLVDI